MSNNPRNQNSLKFQKSISKELQVIKDRVASLIGSVTHHGENGRYREVILKNVIKRFLPSNISMGTGFVVRDPLTTSRQGTSSVSSQIDIILYDNQIPPIFFEGDFVVVTPNMVKGIIEVKSSFSISRLDEEFFPKIVKDIKLFDGVNHDTIFSGLFVFTSRSNVLSENNIDNFRRKIKLFSEHVNHIAWGPNIFVKYWDVNSQFEIYNLKSLSFSYFISNLITSISKFEPEQNWIRFPLREGKSQHRVGTPI